MSENILEIKKLAKSFGTNKVLTDVDLSVKKGDIDVILGPSGTGKSTLLRCLNYLEKPDSGILSINDHVFNFENMSSEKQDLLRKQSCMVFQKYNLFNNKTALGNITESLIVVQKMAKKEAIKIGEHYLEQVGMLDKKELYPSQLSGGQQQRVGIARALANNANLLLIDEPTASLDPELVDEVLSVIKFVAKEMDITMLIVTHELKFAKEIADNIVFMDKGTIAQKSKPTDFFENQTNERIRSFIRLKEQVL